MFRLQVNTQYINSAISHITSDTKVKMSEAPKPTAAPKAPKAKPAHPTYKVMVAAAVTALKDRKGSSKVAIEKFIRANYPVKDSCAGPIKLALKKGVEAGDLVQVTGKGASGSFKLAKVVKKVAKKPAKKVVKKAVAKKTVKKVVKKAPKPSGKVAKKAAAKKAAKKPAKKAAPAKAAPKSKVAAKKAPKPAAKKAKK